MAADASIKRTEELLVFSSFLQSFCDSLVNNGNAFSVLMIQKLEQLKNIQKGAMEVVEQLEEQEREAERAMSARPMGKDYPDRVKICHAIHDKVLAARRYLGTIIYKYLLLRELFVVSLMILRFFRMKQK